MKKIGIVLLMLLLIGCEPRTLLTTENTTSLTTLDTSTDSQTSQTVTTTSIISPKDYIDGIHISSYWYSVMDEDDKWGFIDLDGDVVIPFICDEPAVFENGTTIVTLHGLKGVINFLGNYMLVPVYEDIDSLNHGFLYVTYRSGEDPVVYDNLGNRVFSIEGIDGYSNMNSDDILEYEIGSLNGLISTEGEIITECIFEQINPFYEGIAAVKKDDLWGFINFLGEYTVEPTYLDATNYNHGIVSVLDESGVWKALNADETPDFAFSQTSEIPFDFNEYGISLFVENNLVGQIDIAGNILEPAAYEPKNGGIDMDHIFMDGTYDLIFDPEGGILYKSSNSHILDFIEDAIILENIRTGNYSVIQYSGDFILFPQENFIYFSQDINGDYMIVEPLEIDEDNYYNLYDLEGTLSNKELIHGQYPSFNVRKTVYFNQAEMSRVITFEGYPMFEKEFSVCIFLEDVIILSDGDVMGIVDYYGKVIIPMEYVSIYNFKVIQYIFQNIHYVDVVEE